MRQSRARTLVRCLLRARGDAAVLADLVDGGTQRGHVEVGLRLAEHGPAAPLVVEQREQKMLRREEIVGQQRALCVRRLHEREERAAGHHGSLGARRA